MRRIEIESRADGHDLRRIDAGMAAVVMLFDVQHVDRLAMPSI